MKVKAPKNHVKMNVACQSYRTSGIDIDAIILHSTEGFTGPNGLKDMGNYFDQARTQASSHRGVDRLGRLAIYVPDSKKAWTCVQYNSATLNVEIIGFSSQTSGMWWRYYPQLRKVAYLVAYWSDRHGIPLRKGAASNGRIVKPGVLRHMDLGVAGGNHGDPGANFPMDWVIRKAKKFQQQYHKRSK